jgi:hypothetical protein
MSLHVDIWLDLDITVLFVFQATVCGLTHYYSVDREKTANTNFIILSFTRQKIRPMIFPTPREGVNHNNHPGS